MKMVAISADEYEKLKNEKKESETKIESYKQCIAGYESRIKELTEERDKFKDQYRSAVAKRVLNSAYRAEQAVCCRISKNFNESMFDKISRLSDEIDNMLKENEKLKKESAEKSEWLKAKNEALDNLIIAHNKLEKEYKEFKASSVSLDFHKKLIEDNEKLGEKNRRLEVKISALETQLEECKVTLKAVAIDNNVKDSCIKTLRNQAEEDANKMTELRLKYESVLKANERLAAEYSRLANDLDITKLNNELTALKKRFKDLDNAYKSQRNELFALKYNPIYVDYEKIKISYKEAVNEKERLERELSDAAFKAKKICINARTSFDTINTLADDLEKYII